MSGRREGSGERIEVDPGLRRYVAEEERATTSPNGPAPGPNGRGPMATPRRLGEVLLLARQARGVDLERAARDTKIRSHYLAALESGDFRALPGSVYTKGFLRNYAQYLGLDPDPLIAQYKREHGGTQRGDRTAIVMKTLRAPRAGLTLSRGLFGSVALTLLLVAFGGYVTVQFLRFAQPPTLAVTRPSTVESTIDAESTVLAGTATAGSTVTVTGAGDSTTVSADATGRWSVQVPLVKGDNRFLIVALDPATSKKSDPAAEILIRVPLPPVAEAPILTLSSPADGTAFTNGAIPITGQTTGTSVVIAASYLGPPEGGSSQATPAPPAKPEAAEIGVDPDGSFSGSYEVTAGEWRLTVTATGEENKQTSVTRDISVAYTGLNVVVEIKGGRAWLLVHVDGQLSNKTPTLGGRVFADGTKLRFAADEALTIRTGVASITFVTVNGVNYGRLGASPSPGTWTIDASRPPTQTAS